jgi:hypothetical protein
LLYGQGTESFENSNATASYLNGSFIGDNGFVWNYGHSRNEGDYPINGKGLLLRRASDSYLEAVLPGGIGDFSFDYRKAYTGTSARQLEVFINGVQVATTPQFGTISGEETDIYTLTITNINEPGNVILKIKNIGSTTTNRQAVIDNISWSGYSSEIPVFIVQPSSLSGFSYAEGSGPSQSQYFQLSGENLESIDAIITASSSFEVSSDNLVFTDIFTITDYSGSSVTIYTRLTEDLSVGFQNGNITISGIGVADKIVTLNGRVVEPFLIPYNNAFRTLEDYNNAEAQGVTLNTVEQSLTDGGFLKVFVNGYLETPIIDFTQFSHLEAAFSTATFGTGSNRKLELQISNDGGVSYQSIYSTLPTSTTYDENHVMISLTGVNNVPNGKFKIVMTQGTGQIRFRDFSIQEPEGNVPPIITNIYQHPSLYVTSLSSVSVSADVIDGDGAIAFVELRWGTSSGLYSYTIPMIPNLNNRYNTTTDIPPHIVATSIFYVIYAEDDDNEFSISPERSYTVGDYNEENYYSSVDNLSGTFLWQGLQTIISNNHTALTENQAKSKLYLEIDNYDGLVQCIYTGDWQVPGTPPDFTPIGFSYEHAYAQSWFNASGDNIDEQAWANFDLHHLFPARSDANSSRGNSPFDFVTEITSAWGSVEHFSYRGANALAVNSFEAADEYKGNIARALFYFTVRYYDSDIGLTRFGVDMLPVLYQWHEFDPVDENEVNRNNAVYSVQGNRNPFIDRPEYVSSIWGNLLINSPQNIWTANVGATTFSANWDVLSRGIEYRIDVSTDPNFLIYSGFVTYFKNFQTSGTAISVVGLLPNQTYYYRLRAVDNVVGTLSLNSSSSMVTTSGEVLYYWNFNENVPESESNWTQPISSQVGEGNISYTFGNAISYFGTPINGISGDPRGGSFVPLGGTGSINNGKYLEMSVATTNYGSIMLFYAVRRTSAGFTTHEIQYTIDGNNWLTKEVIDISSFANDWKVNQIILVNFSEIWDINNNENFAIRIKLDGATHATGNNRFDNIQIVGIESTEKLESPQNVMISVIGNEIIITWDAVSGAVSYRVEECDLPDGIFSTATGVLSGTQWTGLTNGGRKFYQVIAE